MVTKKKIVSTPGTLSGRPRIDGHRIGVADVWLSCLRALEELATPKILQEYPQLTEEEIRGALLYARTHIEEIEKELKEAEKARAKGDPMPPEGVDGD